MRGFKRLAGRNAVVVAGELKARGHVKAVAGGVLLLVEAVAVGEFENAPVDGELLVPLSRIDYVQAVNS